MDLVKALRLSVSSTVAFVGAGGKTTAMFLLARQFNGPVIVTATTHLGVWQISLTDEHIVVQIPSSINAMEHNLSGVTLVTGAIKENRTQPIDDKTLNYLRSFYEEHTLPLLIEADGSRQKLLKAPAEHEPAIPEFVENVVQVVGLTGLGQVLSNEVVHRPKIFSTLSGLEVGENITPGALIRVLKSPLGGLKNIPEKARRAIMLNQADTPVLQSQAENIGKKLLSSYDSAIIASLKDEKIYAVREPTAGIILAAGASMRFGKPKQLLDWRGEPFIRAVVKTALEAGLSSVEVVTGANAEDVTATVSDLPVKFAHNQEWQSGQASSIKAGIASIENKVGAAIFLLADQPQITPPILHALMDEHAATLSPIIAPLILEQRGNPVLFDRVTFQDLMNLEGDVGGRGIFSRHRVNYLTWHDDALLLDVDTPEHYQHLKDLLE
jgi:molybdenum cofactor cytidylyltransferase